MLSTKNTPSGPALAQFRTVTVACATLCALLFLVLCFTPKFLLKIIGLPTTEPLAFFASRASWLFLGLAVLNFQGRHITDLPAIKALAVSHALLFAGLFLNGGYGYATGMVNLQIFGPMAIEAGFVILYLRVFHLATRPEENRGTEEGKL